MQPGLVVATVGSREPRRPRELTTMNHVSQLPMDGERRFCGARAVHLPVQGDLREDVSALVGVELGRTGPMPLAVAPHAAWVLTVQLPRGADLADTPGAHKGEPGLRTRLTGIRQWTGAFTGAGDCVTLFALLTPLGAVRLLESQPLEAAPRIMAPVAHLLDDALTRQLEARIAQAGDLQTRLQALAGWLEERAHSRRQHCAAALRAARAAVRLGAQPEGPAPLSIERAADEQHISRRQLERDFGRWLGVSPKHYAQVARVQAVGRQAQAGSPLADVAAGLGFADQSHMNRVVRQLTGLTPRELAHSRRSPIAAPFRAATGGSTVYL
jgi:AraC-like DNA-binding protein